MYSYGAVFKRAVARWFMEECFADVLLSQFVSVPVDGSLGDVLQQVTQSRTLLERMARHDALNELPTLVANKVVNVNRFGKQGNTYARPELRCANLNY